MSKCNRVMTKKLNDKIIVITGGSGLIGSAIINSLICEGARVVNLDINTLKNTQEELDFIECDICDYDASKNAINQIIQKYSRIDGLINNAYPRTTDWGSSFDVISSESWETNVNWQLNSHVYITKYVMETMKKHKKGSIVFMTSIYGMVGNDMSLYEGTQISTAPPYSAIKGALINFSKYLASAYGKFGVRINCISPGGVFDNQDQKFVDEYEKRVPMKRMATPEDIAPSVSFLMSDDAKYITGHNLVIDGGWTSI